ncbi:DUF5709 domain-containing protein [Yinghuangia soli]|uniref:DUF5709 domain-containing protein n=1 Tax=Yinghuangia soli TaxID=2908204 RepID=A0AA41Q5Q9_9ACTN|nr:DUF5709 domain-containing protein [Yinghuangia soli]MCF2532054.1 DUF5709 domain-containing protein [Yinghuangia soli]
MSNSDDGRRRGPRPSSDQPYEDPTLDASETLITDDLSADPLDVGVVPPDHYSAAERFGTTAEEAERGESLDQLLDEEEPELEPEDMDEIDDRWADGPSPRSGRLVAAGPGGTVELFAEDVGIDAGAATAEEAAVHIVDDLSDEDFDEEPEFPAEDGE